jgi:hypothetical protein
MTNITLQRRFLARWKIIIAIIIMLGIGSYFSYTVISSSWSNYQLMQRGETIQGYIIDTWEDVVDVERGSVSYIYGATYTYQLPDSREFMGKVEGEGRLKPEFRFLKQPYPVEVTYLLDNPAVSCISANLPDSILGAFRHSPMQYLLAALFLSLGFYLLWWLIREVAHSSEHG